MSLVNQNITALENQLRSGENLDDLLLLLNTIVEWQNSSFSTKRSGFTRKQLAFFYRNIDEKYRTFQIAKKSGGSRSINAPYKTLKAIQKCLADLLQNIYEPPFAVNGFVLGRSIVSNARVHTGKKFVLNIDLENFFSSIKFGRVSAVLQLKPISAKSRFAYLLSKYCCQNGVLPQGAPTSPILSNLICYRLDQRITQLSKGQQIVYTRYADDLSFSSNQPFQNGFLNRLGEIIQEEGFSINPKKVRLVEKNSRQEVTGLTINEKTNVSRVFIREVRAMLNNWATLGYNNAQARFLSNYKVSDNVEKKSIPQLRSVVGGKINYLKMVRGNDDPVYQKYKKIYEQLLKGDYIRIKNANQLLTKTEEHNPRQVVSFLRNFKVVNNSGFRELLHDPDVEIFDFEANLQLVNDQLAGLSTILPKALYQKVVSFIEVYNTFGLKYFKDFGYLPLKGYTEWVELGQSYLTNFLTRNGKRDIRKSIVTSVEPVIKISPSEEVTKAANKFRTQIRIGNEYFHDLVLVNALKPSIEKLNEINNITINYHPSEEEFSLNCEFFTDSWEVWKAIRSLLKDLVYNPYYKVKGRRMISISSAIIKRQTDQENFFASIIYLKLIDSVVEDSNRAFSQSRLTKTQKRLKMLADWTIIYQIDNGEIHEHTILNSTTNKIQTQLIDGITHRLTFFQS